MAASRHDELLARVRREIAAPLSATMEHIDASVPVRNPAVFAPPQAPASAAANGAAPPASPPGEFGDSY